MQFTTFLVAVILASIDSVAASATTCCVQPTRYHQEKMMSQYLKTWNGDWNLLNSTFMPDVHLYQDRFPTETGSEPLDFTTSEQFLAFMQRSHDGWERYAFKVITWAADKHLVTVRWTLDAIMGPNFPKRILIGIKPGDSVTYNGTDLLYLHECTGLIKQVDSAQDFINLFHSLGVSTIHV